jgi:sec-independent protein translocase protein TatC
MGVLFAGIVLFLAGAALAYFEVIPLALPWLFGFAGPSLVPLITAEEYFSFVFAMVLTFGVSFELPIVILALSALGIVTPQLLSKYRRHAIVAIVIIGAFLTPGDLVWTTIALSVPLYGLYELSVLAAYVIYRRKNKRAAALEKAEHSGATA